MTLTPEDPEGLAAGSDVRPDSLHTVRPLSRPSEDGA